MADLITAVPVILLIVALTGLIKVMKR